MVAFWISLIVPELFAVRRRIVRFCWRRADYGENLLSIANRARFGHFILWKCVNKTPIGFQQHWAVH